jgi:hypothetical protein
MLMPHISSNTKQPAYPIHLTFNEGVLAVLIQTEEAGGAAVWALPSTVTFDSVQGIFNQIYGTLAFDCVNPNAFNILSSVVQNNHIR